jgi:hypothetical protein
LFPRLDRGPYIKLRRHVLPRQRRKLLALREPCVPRLGVLFRGSRSFSVLVHKAEAWVHRARRYDRASAGPCTRRVPRERDRVRLEWVRDFRRRVRFVRAVGLARPHAGQDSATFRVA